MAALPKLTEAEIQTWVDNASFTRGRTYARNGSILAPRCQGNTLKAQCLGSAATPYRVEVVLGAKGIVSGRCSCPIGDDGRCKHVAALLLSWVNDPAAFTVVEELATLLAQRSKEELMSLIAKMIDRYPDLERLLELPIVRSGKASVALDAGVIERQVNQIFKQIDDYYEYDSSDDIVQELTNIKSLGDQYAAVQAWGNAATVYKTVLKGVLDNYEMLGDEEGEFGEIVNACVAGLEPCLAAATDGSLRQTILRTLFDVQRWDINWGGIDMGHEAPELIAAYATPTERTLIATWVRAELVPDQDFYAAWKRNAWGGFLLTLEAENLDDETFLQICRESGMHLELVKRLLELGRTDEAVAATDATNVHELLAMESLFAAHKLTDRFVQAVTARATQHDDRQLKGWLKQYAITQDDPALALKLVAELFWSRPNLAEYQEMQQLAQYLQKWPPLQAEILRQLHADPQQYGLLIRIYLLDNEIDAALRLLYSPQKPQLVFGWSELRLDVARAAEATHPHAAISIYREKVDAQIAQRQRSSYAIAAEYLGRMRSLYQSLNDLVTWQNLLAEIRTNHPTLRALHDELRKAGL